MTRSIRAPQETTTEERRYCLPALDVCDVAGAGHMVAGERNDAFNRTVMNFLLRHVRVA